MRLAVNQPTFLPWLGWFELVDGADRFVAYDHVAFSRQSWQQRNRIRGPAGELLLTVPTRHTGELHVAIHDVQIAREHRFAKKHLMALQANYARAPYYRDLAPELEEIYGRNHERLVDLNLDLIRWGMKQFGIPTPTVCSSELGVKGDRVPALVDLCLRFGADEYYSPAGSREYIGEGEPFQAAGIRIRYQDFQHPRYAQAGHPDFMSHLAFLDYLFNEGPGDPPWRVSA